MDFSSYELSFGYSIAYQIGGSLVHTSIEFQIHVPFCCHTLHWFANRVFGYVQI